MENNKKRITIYLDTNIESDRIVWEFLKGKRKNEIIRPLLYNFCTNFNKNPPKNDKNPQKIEENNNFLLEELENLNDFIK